MKEKLSLRVNNERHTVETDPDTPLLYVLRNALALNGPKFGCGLEQCGACMVLIDGRATTSCRLPVSAVKDKSITTLRGLTGSKGNPHPLQQAFFEEQAAQCGYCLNGMIISAASLISSNPNPGIDEIRSALQLNLCRCGTHTRYLKAILRAVNTMSGK